MSMRQREKMRQVSDDVLGVSEAAQLLGAHVETVRRLARSGGVPSYKVGRDWRFSRAALLQWIASQHDQRRPSTVMVVDDEKSLRDTVALFLQADNYRVVTAPSGDKAIQAAQQELPDLVLLDLVMPGMSGVEVLKALHYMRPELPVIILTGHPDSALLTEALRYPPVTLLPKPVDRDQLLGAVRRVLEGARPKKRN